MNRGGRILVVDDEEALRRATEELLRRHGYSVQTASNGAEAMELLTAGQFDVVLTDMNMPVMDGLELIRSIRQKALPLAVIPMSGGHPRSSELLAQAMRLGGRPPLAKPFKAEQLLNAVESALGSDR